MINITASRALPLPAMISLLVYWRVLPKLSKVWKHCGIEREIGRGSKIFVV